MTFIKGAEIDWDGPRSGRGDTRCHVVGCDEKKAAFVSAMVRLPKTNPSGSSGKGYGSQLASKQHGYCKHHAEILYAKLHALIEESAAS